MKKRFATFWNFGGQKQSPTVQLVEVGKPGMSGLTIGSTTK